MLTLLYVGWLGVYIIFTIALGIGWKRLVNHAVPSINPDIWLTVLVVVRNEAHNIQTLLDDFAKQTFQKFDVLIIDDNSIDGTIQIVQNFRKTANFELNIISYQRLLGTIAHKKACITLGVNHARGEYIVSTDGDCRVGPDWLMSIAQAITATKAVFVSAPVTFTDERTLFEKMQTIEFASLIGAGAVTLAYQKPTMCSAANMVYQKRAFYAVGGYQGFEHIASGDDEFLLHKISKAFPDKTIYLKDKRAIVHTYAVRTLYRFWLQRTRWGSKWTSYQNPAALLTALFVFSFHLFNLISFILCLLGWLSWWIWGAMQVFKLLAEWIFLANILIFFEKKSFIKLIPIVQLVHSVYIIIVGLGGLFVKPAWKK